MSSAAASDDRRGWHWFVTVRWQEFSAESRANLLRLLAIAAFYAVELANHYGLRLGVLELPPVAGVDESFHRAVTGLAVAWVLVALTVALCLARRIFPAALKYASTGADLLLLSIMLMVADGPRSPLVVGYFLIVAVATLRFSLPLVRCATAGAIVGYLSVLGYARWFTERDLRIERYQQVMFLLALALTGLILGQVVRRARQLAEEYAARVNANGGPLA